MCFLVAWISRISFTLGLDVGEHGVGCVVRNIVAHITTRGLVRNHRRPRITTVPAVEMRRASRKKNIALGDIIRIVGRGGRDFVESLSYFLEFFLFFLDLFFLFDLVNGGSFHPRPLLFSPEIPESPELLEGTLEVLGGSFV